MSKEELKQQIMEEVKERATGELVLACTLFEDALQFLLFADKMVLDASVACLGKMANVRSSEFKKWMAQIKHHEPFIRVAAEQLEAKTQATISIQDYDDTLIRSRLLARLALILYTRDIKGVDVYNYAVQTLASFRSSGTMTDERINEITDIKCR